MNYPQHPEKKQRNMRLKPAHFWGVWDDMCSDELSDDESVTTILSVVVVAVVAVVAAVFSSNDNF